MREDLKQVTLPVQGANESNQLSGGDHLVSLRPGVYASADYLRVVSDNAMIASMSRK